MILQINLNQDQELRKSIYELVKAQTISLIREEVAKVAEQKINSVVTEYLTTELQDRIKSIIGPKWGESPLKQAFVDKVTISVNQRINELAGDVDKDSILSAVAKSIINKYEKKF